MPHLRCRIQEESSLQPFVFVFAVTNGHDSVALQDVLRCRLADFECFCRFNSNRFQVLNAIASKTSAAPNW